MCSVMWSDPVDFEAAPTRLAVLKIIVSTHCWMETAWLLLSDQQVLSDSLLLYILKRTRHTNLGVAVILAVAYPGQLSLGG